MQKTIIKDNYFNTAGAEILFESNGSFWFESGGTTDVVIENNVFEDCRYGKWCSAVIEAVPREKMEKYRYFHKSIKVIGNTFKNCNSRVLNLDNVENIFLKDNETIDCSNEYNLFRN